MQHSFWIKSHKVGPNIYFIIYTYIQHYTVIWRSMNVNLHCMVHTMIIILHCKFLYFYTIYKVSHNKVKRRESLSPLHTPPLRPFHVRTQTISRSSKSKPQHIHACFIFLSRYIQWRSLYLKRKHDTYIGLQNPLITVTFTFCGYYTVMGSPYNSVFSQDMTSWPVKRSMWHL